MKKILYLDMDGVLVDFQSRADKVSDNEKRKYKRVCYIPHIFSTMKPIEGAIEAFDELNEYFDVYILSAAPWGNDTSCRDKIGWVKKYLGKKAYKRLILSHHKNLNKGDFLVDDRLKNGAAEFEGEHIQFGTKKFPNWKVVKKYLIEKK